MTDKTPLHHKSIWHMVAAPVVWALHFVAIYAWTAIDCAKTDTPDPARIVIAALTVLALALIASIGWRAWVQWDYPTDHHYVHDKPSGEDRREFLGHVGFLLSVLSAIGVIFAALPAIFIRNCL